MYAKGVSRSNAIRSGFSAVFRRPAVFVAELAWRWAFGAAALLLLTYGILIFLASTPVSERDLLGLSGVVPGAFRAALAHIFNGSGPQLARLVFSLTIGLSFLWWLASALGRAAVLQELVVQRQLSAAPALRIMLQLNLMRSIVFLLTVLAYVASFVVAARAASAGQITESHGKALAVDFGTFYLIFLPLAFIIGWAWSTLNWYLSLAPLVALRNGLGALSSISDAVQLAVRHYRQFFWVGFAFAAMRFVLTVVVLFLAVSTIGVFSQVSAGLAMVVTFILFLGYCAVSDFLAVAKLAAYARIIEWDTERPTIQPVTVKPISADLMNDQSGAGGPGGPVSEPI